MDTIEQEQMTVKGAIRWASRGGADAIDQTKRLEWLRNSGQCVPRDIGIINKAILEIRKRQGGKRE